MSEHTPGHWHASGYAVFAGKNCIAVCDTDNSKPERYDANARLIAAAPEMLEALRGLANALEMEPGPRGVMDLVPGAIEKARAAIAKAEGRS